MFTTRARRLFRNGVARTPYQLRRRHINSRRRHFKSCRCHFTFVRCRVTLSDAIFNAAVRILHPSDAARGKFLLCVTCAGIYFVPSSGNLASFGSLEGDSANSLPSQQLFLFTSRSYNMNAKLRRYYERGFCYSITTVRPNDSTSAALLRS